MSLIQIFESIATNLLEYHNLMRWCDLIKLIAFRIFFQQGTELTD